MVIGAVPLKETPLMVCAFWRAEAVAALPPMLRVLVAAKARAVPAEFVYISVFGVKEARPVPPFDTARVPVSDGAKVKAEPEFVMLRPRVRPVPLVDEVPNVSAPV